MKVLFRTDASRHLGSGHLVRCLNLADELRRHGVLTRFICQELPQYLETMVRHGGHELSILPGNQAPSARDAETAWPASEQFHDALETARAAAPMAWDWLVVDHYGLGHVWEQSVRLSARWLMAIDDLARQHDCDALLDPTFHEDARGRYADKLGASALLLLGPRYALLHADFLAERSAARVRLGPVRRILVFLGGMDAQNLTSTVLQAIDMLDVEPEVDVVIGAAHPARELIEKLCTARSHMTCHVQTRHMARLCAKADLAIGAGGGATWERCALGVPTLALCIAQNQQVLLEQGARHGFAYVPDDTRHTASSIAMHLRALLANTGLREHLSRNAMALVDAKGTARVAAFMRRSNVAVRAATTADKEALLRWRNDPRIRKASRNNEVVHEAAHAQWLEHVLSTPERHLLIGEINGAPLGVVRYDGGPSSTELSIYVAPDGDTAGGGLALLLAAQAWVRQHHPERFPISAEVLEGNEASHQLFRNAGFTRHSVRYVKEN